MTEPSAAEPPTENRTNDAELPGTEGPATPAGEADESLHDRLLRMRAGTENEGVVQEPEPAAPQAPRIQRKVRRVAAEQEEIRKQAARKDRGDAAPVAKAGAKPSRGAAPPPVPAVEEEPPDVFEAPEEVETRLAERIAALRGERGWSLQDLARRSGVSRSTLSRVERGQISPTATVLARLATAYDRTLSALLAEVESEPRSLVRAAEQTITGDEISGWRRRAVSPPYPGLHAQVVDVVVSPGSQAVEDPPIPGSEQHLWLLSGTLEYTPVTETGETSTHALHTGMADAGETTPAADESLVLVRGDCLRLRAWGQARLRCLSPDPARYALVTIPP